MAVNDVRIMFHNSRDIPMFYDNQAAEILLTYDEPDYRHHTALQVYKYLVSAEERKISKEVARKSLSSRKCKLRTETEGLKWFTKYTEKNCLFECKARIAQSSCGCFPVWMMDYLGQGEGVDISVCTSEVLVYTRLITEVLKH